MEILIIAGQPEESLIDNKTRVEDLPTGLKAMILEGLRRMREAKKIIVFFKEGKLSEKTIIELPTKNVLLVNANGFQREAKQKFVQVLELLRWHLSPRWRPYLHSRAVYCTDCETSATPPATECVNPDCPSHEKRRLIMGE